MAYIVLQTIIKGYEYELCCFVNYHYCYNEYEHCCNMHCSVVMITNAMFWLDMATSQGLLVSGR